MQEKLWKVMLVYSLLFSAAAMSVMLYFSATKTIVIAQEAASDYTDNEKKTGDMQGEVLHFRENTDGKGIRIPLPPEIRADDIVIENRYIEHSVSVLLTGEYKEFYGSHYPEGKDPKVTGATVGEEDGITRLQLLLTGPWEQQYVFENGMLYLTFAEPSALYDKIVILDVEQSQGGAGRDDGMPEDKTAADIVLGIADRVVKEMEDSDIRIYCTGTDSPEVTAEEKIKFAEDVQADMLIGIRAGADSDSGIYGMRAYYNRRYFIPYFGNTELADLLLGRTAEAVGGRADGLYEAGDDESLLQYMQIPSAVLQIGYVTNENERSLLASDAYEDKLAEGIAEAIREAFEETSGEQ